MRSEESRAQRHVNKNGRESRLVAILGPMTILFLNSELRITLLFVNIIVNTECQHSKHSSAGLYVFFSFYFRLT